MKMFHAIGFCFLGAAGALAICGGVMFFPKPPNPSDAVDAAIETTPPEHMPDDNVRMIQRKNAGVMEAMDKLEERISQLEDQRDEVESTQESSDKDHRSLVDRLHDMRKKSIERRTEEIARFETVLSAQDNDPEWTEFFTAKIRNIIHENEFVGTNLDAVECKSNVCKMVFSHETGAPREENMEEISLIIPDVSRGFFAQEGSEEEGWRTLLYVVRSGHPL